MEKRSHSRITKTKPYLVYQQDYSAFLREFNNDSFFDLIEEASIEINKIDTFYLFKICDSSGKILDLNKRLLEKPINFFKDLQNLKICLNLIKARINSEQREKTNKKEHSLNKKLNTLTSTYSLDAHSLIEVINNFCQSNIELEAVLQFLPSLLDYKNYQSFQLLCLRKGHSLAHSYQFSGTELKHDLIKTNDYNHLFNLIKKSKNKFFDQSTILNKELNVVGTFLAKEKSIKEFQLIFIVSRHDMFPATREERKNFELVAKLVAPHVYQLLKQKDLSQKLNYIREGLKNFPFSLSIADAQGKIIFDNHVASEHQKMIQPIKLNENYNAFIDFPDNHNEYFTDHTHHERVQLLGELLNTLKHELGNPLFGISLTTELFEQENLGQDSKTILQEISANSSRCLKVIKNFSFLYQDTKTILPTNVEKLVHEVLTISKSETRKIKKTVNISSSLKQNDLIVRTNPTLLTQVLFNLILNSAQSLSEQKGERLISIDIEYADQKLIIHIKDNGPGIPRSMRQEIFKPFYTTKEKGTGLGLSICRRAMASLGGSIELVSKPPYGAHFILELPHILIEDSLEKHSHY